MTDLDTRNAAAITSLLDAADSGESVYNVDFTEWKDRASRAYDRQGRGGLYDTMPRGDDAPEGDREVYWAMPMELHHITSKKFAKLLDKSENTPYVVAVRAVVAKWTPIAEAIKTVKKNVIKGRKPSATPRITPERTLDNTGTCAICGKNVKLNGGKVVNHGYTVRYGFFQGGCFGVGYDPIEVSPTALHDYMSALVSHKDRIIGLNNDESIAAIIAKMDDATRAKRASRPDAIKAGFERDLRMLTADIEMFGKMINTWEARPLPDAA